MALRNGKLPFWKVFTTFLLSQNALRAFGVSAQNDETDGTTAEITINRAIEIGKLSSLIPSASPLFAHNFTALFYLQRNEEKFLHFYSEKCKHF